MTRLPVYLAGLTDKSYDAYIGLIVGTGTNMATFIPSDKITKLDPECHVQGFDSGQPGIGKLLILPS